MSTIKANDIQNASGGIPTVKGQRLIPTAWVNFNGTGTVAIRDSEGVSSITDVGVGIYDVTFANSMANDDYSFAGSATFSATAAQGTYVAMSGTNNILTSKCRLEVRSSDGLVYDAISISGQFLGGQA